MSTPTLKQKYETLRSEVCMILYPFVNNSILIMFISVSCMLCNTGTCDLRINMIKIQMITGHDRTSEVEFIEIHLCLAQNYRV